MINGTYRIVMKTLLGEKGGRLTLYEKGRVLTGFMDILGHRNEIHDGVAINGECRFAGEFITPVRTIAFTAEGRADDRSIALQVRAGPLNMDISGELDSGPEKGG